MNYRAILIQSTTNPMILVKFFDFCSHSVPLPCVIVTTQSQAYFFLTGSLTLRAPSSFELSACPAQDVESQMLGGRLMPLFILSQPVLSALTSGFSSLVI